jgi:hypothetical protein
MHDPQKAHLGAIKRILRYLQGTMDLCLHLHRTSLADLIVYTNADWAGCLAHMQIHVDAVFLGTTPSPGHLSISAQCLGPV